MNSKTEAKTASYKIKIEEIFKTYSSYVNFLKKIEAWPCYIYKYEESDILGEVRRTKTWDITRDSEFRDGLKKLMLKKRTFNPNKIKVSIYELQFPDDKDDIQEGSYGTACRIAIGGDTIVWDPSGEIY